MKKAWVAALALLCAVGVARADTFSDFIANAPAATSAGGKIPVVEGTPPLARTHTIDSSTLIPSFPNAATYGMVGDGAIATGIVTTAGAEAFTGHVFDAADVGKAIIVPGAGANGAPLVTTLATTTSFATAATMSISASTFYAALGRTCPVATPQSGAGNYAPGDTIALANSVSCIIQYTNVASATIDTPGVGCTNDTNVRFRTTTGTGAKAWFNANVAGGIVTIINFIEPNLSGRFTVNPTDPDAEPVAGFLADGVTPRCATPPTFTIKMGVGIARVSGPGRLTAVPADPVAQVSTSGAGTGATFNMLRVPKVGTPNAWIGTIGPASTTMTVTDIPAGDSVLVGQQIEGAGVTPGTTVTVQLTGTTGQEGTYTVSPSQSVGAAFTASIADNLMTVTAVASGSILRQQLIFGTGVAAGTVVAQQITGSAGSTGTYQVSGIQTVGSVAMTARSAISASGPTIESIWQTAGTAHYGTNNGPGMTAMMAATDSPRVSFPAGVFLLPCGQYEAASSVSMDGAGTPNTIFRLFPFCTQDTTASPHLFLWENKPGVTLSGFTIDANYAVSSKRTHPQLAALINNQWSDGFSMSGISANNIGNLWTSYNTVTTSTKGVANPTMRNLFSRHPYPDSTATLAFVISDGGETGVTGLMMNNITTIGGNNSVCALGGIITNWDASYTGYGSNFSTRPVNVTPNCRDTIIMGLAAHEGMGFLDTNNTPNSGYEIHGSKIILIGGRFWNNTGDGLRCQSDGAFIRDILSYNNGRVMPFDDISAGMKVLGPNVVNPLGCGNSDIDGVKTYDEIGNQFYGYKETLGPVTNPLMGVRLGRGNRFSGTNQDMEILGNTVLDHQGAAGTIHPGYIVGNYYSPGRMSPSGTGAAPGVNLAICYPGSVEQPATVSTLGAAVTTADAAGSFQLAIYNNGSWGRPSTLISATGDISTAATVAIDGVMVGEDPPLLPGITYWFCSNTNSATAVLRAFSIASTAAPPATMLIGSSTLGSVVGAAPLSAVSVAQAYNTWPTWTSATGWGDVTTVIAPLIAMKIGSLP